MRRDQDETVMVQHPGKQADPSSEESITYRRSILSEESPLRRQLREANERIVVLRYHRKPSKRKLVKMMELSGVPEALPLIQAFRRCTRYRPCQRYTCSVCGPKIKAKAKDHALAQIVCRLGRFPKNDEISFITIHGPVISLETQPEAARSVLDKFEQRLRNFQKRRAKTTSWLGFFDISVGGRVHWHGLVLHSDIPQGTWKALLKQSFDEEDQVVVSRWDQRQSLVENLQGVLNYAIVAERHTKIYVRENGPERDIGLVYNIRAITRRIILVQALAGQGVRGLRMSINMKPTVRGMKVKELENLRRRTRRIRNTKTMLNKPWAPRGSIGTHLNGEQASGSMTINGDGAGCPKGSMKSDVSAGLDGGAKGVTGSPCQGSGGPRY